jgi:hypothetical protein
LKQVIFDNCHNQYAVVGIVTGQVASYERAKSAESVARSRAKYGETHVVIDLHTGRVTDVFGVDSHLSTGINGVRVMDEVKND